MPQLPTAADLQKVQHQGPSFVPFVPGHSMDSYGRGIENLGESISKAAAYIDNSDSAIDLIKAEAAHRKGLFEIERDLLQDNNYQTYDQKFNERVRQLREQTSSMIRNDRHREQWAAKAEMESETSRNKILNHGFAMKRQDQIGQLDDSLNTHLNIAIDPSTSEQQRSESALAYKESLKVARASGIISPIKERKLLEDWGLNTSKYSIQQRIENGEPLDAIIKDIRKSGPAMASPFAMTGMLETGKNDPLVGIANVSKDTRVGGKVGKSYGNLGLWSGGSMQEFVAKHGKEFGLTAEPGTKEFDEQWINAASAAPVELHAKEVEWWNDKIAPRISSDLTAIGVPDDIANDQSVRQYFGDRLVQYGPESIKNHKDRIVSALQSSGDDPAAFLAAMSATDKGNIQRDFLTYLRDNPKNVGGLINRITQRESMSTGVGGSGPYADLSPKNRFQLIKEVTTAYKSRSLMDMKSAEEELRRTGRMPVDANGTTALDRAAHVLPPNQLAKVRKNLLVAKADYDATANLENMSDADGYAWVDKLNPVWHDRSQPYPLEGVDLTENYDVAGKLYDKAKAKWDNVIAAREKDPAKAVMGSQEVTAIRERVKQFGGQIPLTNQNEMVVQARLAAQERLGIPESQRHVVTAHEAGMLLSIPKNATDDDISKEWAKATARAKAVYGKYWKEALDSSVELAIRSKELRETARDLLPSNSEAVVKKNEAGYFDWIFGGSEAPKAAPAQPEKPKPTDAQINWVMESPKERAPVFDQKFGPGSFTKIFTERNATKGKK